MKNLCEIYTKKNIKNKFHIRYSISPQPNFKENNKNIVDEKYNDKYFKK